MAEKKSLFDIKPINDLGVVETQLVSVLDLKIKKVIKEPQSIGFRNEFEKILNSNLDFKGELVKAGARMEELETEPAIPDVDYDKVLLEINRAHFGISSKIDKGNFYNPKEEQAKPAEPEVANDIPYVRPRNKIFKKVLFLAIVVAIGFFIWKYGLAL